MLSRKAQSDLLVIILLAAGVYFYVTTDGFADLGIGDQAQDRENQTDYGEVGTGDPSVLCFDGVDNDQDGYTDCNDYDCSLDTTVCDTGGGGGGGTVCGNNICESGETVTSCAADCNTQPAVCQYKTVDGYYCRENWGDVYLDGQEVQNCWSAYETCVEFDGSVGCVESGLAATCENVNYDDVFDQAKADAHAGGGGGGPVCGNSVCESGETETSCASDCGSGGGGGSGSGPGDGSNGFVPTFHSIGISWNPTNKASSETAKVEYKEASASTWNDALDLWNAGDEYRGSIMFLNSGTDYDVRLTLSPNGETITQTVHTWNKNLPEGQVVTVPASSSTYTISTSGTSSGYVVYDCQGNTIDVNRNSDVGIYVNSGVHHVIIRNCIIAGALKHGIYLSSSTHDVVVEHNDISGWGSGTENRLGGIKFGEAWSDPTPGYRFWIHHNNIHDPAGYSNSWDDGHPGGPQGIDFSESSGQNVIEYNSCYSTNGNMFNDCIAGDRNLGPNGFPGPNSDINNNYCANVWDDCIEAEGSGENVRIWNNYMDNYAIGIASVDVNVGPWYAVRNVFDVSYRSEADSGKSGLAFKVGDLDSSSSARRYILHNTVLQTRDGVGAFIHRTDGGMTDAYVVNNIAPLRSGNSFAHISAGDGGCNNYADYDLYEGNIWGECAGYENNGIKGAPTWDGATTYNYPAGRTFRQTLASGSDGVDMGIVLPNINDGYAGTGPDVGAVERGSNGFCFGHGCGVTDLQSLFSMLFAVEWR